MPFMSVHFGMACLMLTNQKPIINSGYYQELSNQLLFCHLNMCQNYSQHNSTQFYLDQILISSSAGSRCLTRPPSFQKSFLISAVLRPKLRLHLHVLKITGFLKCIKFSQLNQSTGSGISFTCCCFIKVICSMCIIQPFLRKEKMSGNKSDQISSTIINETIVSNNAIKNQTITMLKNIAIDFSLS